MKARTTIGLGQARPPLSWGSTLAVFGLIGPAITLMVAILLPALGLLLVNSAYHFTGTRIERIVTFEAYRQFFTDAFYAGVIYQEVRLAVISTGLCLAIGYPTAYVITKIRRPGWVIAAYILIFSPLLTSAVVRAYGWRLILGGGGIANWLLASLHITEAPVRLIFNLTGVVTGLVHFLLPFTVFPILSVLLRMDPALREAAADLGATRWRTFRYVTWPLSFPGLYAGAQLTFVLAMNAFVTPQLLGGGRVLVLPILIYHNVTNLHWPLAAVEAIVLITLVWVTVFISNLFLRKTLTHLQGVA
jgi:putative spermidine/putrescine transport system permease protein